METSFHYDLAQKQLNFKLRERITAPPGVELKGNGYFNTTTGNLGYVGTMKAGVNLGQEEKDIGSKPLKLSAGVYVQGQDTKAMPKPELHLCAKKTISLFDGPRTVASAKAWGNFDPQSGQVTTRKAVLKLSHKWLGFTQRQDLKLTAGVDVDWPLGAREPVAIPFGQVRENNWALNYRRRGWFVTYDL